MKYAFLLGSNLFVVPGNTISFTDNEGAHRFLRILSVNQPTPPDQPRAVLTIDADIKDNQGNEIHLIANKPEVAPPYDIMEQTDRVIVTRPNGSTVLDVHQLDDHSARSLEHNIVAEIEVNAPVAVIRVRGDFIVGDLHVEIDNEKLFLGEDSYANSVLAGSDELQFSHSGVLI
ncbi:hypothetical protein [Mucilaginibacter ginsenosidivorans]|uniref:Uncharacterized protein n=1 Tax=Mucilaginibacter ginsenosidivorans TaxID=398053 RepID=A0A5B8UWF0_9SPHI|nr:hypothetical protein [Mucilaginibacter ginsenosidivorans]QEC63239.1 hypothetical protein FRZ54_11830 [Mucilaginibacter ginsenosidivorans]